MRARHLKIRGTNRDYGFDTRATEENDLGYKILFYIYEDGEKKSALWEEFTEEEKSRMGTLAKRFGINL